MARFSPRALAGSAWRHIKAFRKAHPFWSIVIVLALVVGGWWGYGKLTAVPAVTRYITAQAATDTVVATLTETGQVSAKQQLTLSPQASGQIVAIYVKPGQKVYAGQAIAQLDATDARQTLTDAQLSLKNAQITYQQDIATSTLALNLLTAKNGVTNAETALAKAHDDAYASIASIYGDLSDIMTGLDSTLHDMNVPGHTNQQNIDAFTDNVYGHDKSIPVFQNSAQNSYTAAYTAYNDALTAYKATNRTISNDDLLTLAQNTYAAAQSVAQAVKDASDFFDRVNNDYTLYNLGSSSVLTTLTNNVSGYTTTVNTDLANALTAKTNIVNAEQSLAQAQNTLEIQQQGTNTLTVQQAALALSKAQEAVRTAEQGLADYTVTAPFAGTIASVNAQVYDQASSGTNVAVLVANQNYATLSVNEVDAAKIKDGQKATITFDALPDVTLTGTVTSVDPIGTVTQGVVSYTVLISFDTSNPQVKPGMSLTADIVTGTQTGLVVPASAVKSAGTQSYVEVFDPPLASTTPSGTPSDTPPKAVPVTTGLTDDTQTVITKGLSAGAQVVSQTIGGGNTISSAAQSTSAFGNRPRGGAVFRAGG